MIDEDYTGKKIKIFAVGADYDVYEDTKYFSEGIIYNFLILEEQKNFHLFPFHLYLKKLFLFH